MDESTEVKMLNAAFDALERTIVREVPVEDGSVLLGKDAVFATLRERIRDAVKWALATKVAAPWEIDEEAVHAIIAAMSEERSHE